MTKSLLFWIVFVIAALVYFGFLLWPDAPTWRGNATVGVQFLLIFLLGWGIYGPPIKG